MAEDNRALKLAQVRDLVATGQARQIRLRARLSYPEIADAVGGIAHTTILRWERGDRRPTGDHALRYLDLLNRLAEQQVKAVTS